MTKIKVYLEDGRVFGYDVENATKAREHAHRIINYGWRNEENGVMCYYPIARINKVVFDMPDKDLMAGKYFAEPL